MGDEGPGYNFKLGHRHDCDDRLVCKGDGGAGRHLTSAESKPGPIHVVAGAYGRFDASGFRVPAASISSSSMRLCIGSSGSVVTGDSNSKPCDHDGGISSSSPAGANCVRPVSIVSTNCGSVIATTGRRVDCGRSILHVLLDLLLHKQEGTAAQRQSQ